MSLAKLEYKWLVGIVYVLALFMDLLDMTIITVAVPTLANEFSASTTTIEWVVTGYLLSLAVFIPISGWLGDRFGTKRTFMTALSIFLAGSILCGLAWDIDSLIAFRVVQGVGGGMLTPVGMAMLFRAFPPAERAAASAVLAIPITVAPALGPLLGGYLVGAPGFVDEGQPHSRENWQAASRLGWYNAPVSRTLPEAQRT
jgi:EmrB/QacA subfamily drug resistance transporter